MTKTKNKYFMKGKKNDMKEETKIDKNFPWCN